MQSTLSWQKVEEYLAQKNQAGNLMAFIETEKVFAQVLDKLKFPGRNIDAKVEGLKYVISNFEGLKIARQNYKKIITQPDFTITPQEIEKLMEFYYKAIEEIAAWQNKKHDIFTKLKIRLAVTLPQPRESVKRFIIGFVAIFFIIFVLDSTKTGHIFIGFLARISHFIFSWLLFGLLLIIGLIIITVGIIMYLDSRKNQKISK